MAHSPKSLEVQTLYKFYYTFYVIRGTKQFSTGLVYNMQAMEMMLCARNPWIRWGW